MDCGCDIVPVLDRGGCDLPLAEEEVILVPDYRRFVGSGCETRPARTF